MKILITFLLTTTTFMSSCDTDTTTVPMDEVIASNAMAKILNVTTSGSENNYNFNVGVSSPDTGCDQYADWWEVLTEDGTLLYRRILAHSHVNEQPFVRSGGPVATGDDAIVIIRAHMNTSGYGTEAFIGSINSGFNEVTLETDFAQNLATMQPLPDGCAF